MSKEEVAALTAAIEAQRRALDVKRATPEPATDAAEEAAIERRAREE